MRSVKKKQSAIVNVYVYYRALLRTMKWKNGRGLGRVALDILQALSTRPDSNLLAFALPLLSRRLLRVWMDDSFYGLRLKFGHFTANNSIFWPFSGYRSTLVRLS